MFHLIPNLEKKPDNIIIHIETNDAPYKNENVLYEWLKQIKYLIIDHHPEGYFYLLPHSPYRQ